MSLREQVEQLYAKGGGFDSADREVFESFKQALNRGEVRAAERDREGRWRVNSWVKSGILAGFRMGALTDMSAHASLRFPSLVSPIRLDRRSIIVLLLGRT